MTRKKSFVFAQLACDAAAAKLRAFGAMNLPDEFCTSVYAILFCST